MQAFLEHTGLVAILNRADVDTDQIVPKQFLKKIERTGFGKHLFHDWRYLDNEAWEPKKPNPKFELNKKCYEGASILIAGENFGCGSSREHAPWALADYGFKVILAPSFADIFYNNCLKNGLLVIALETKHLQNISQWVNENEGASITVNLEKQEIYTQNTTYNFEIDSIAKKSLIEGLDEIGLTLKNLGEIEAFEKKHFSEYKYYIPKINTL